MVNTAQKVMRAAISANVPIFLRGGSGIGKTSIIEQYARASGRHLETIIGSSIAASDVGGFPVHDETSGTMDYAPLRWARTCAEAPKALIFLGEYNTSPLDVQRAFLRPIQERKVGEQELPDTVSIILDGNRPEFSVGASHLTGPTANRMLHLDWKLDQEAWLSGMLDGFAAGEESFDDTIPPSPRRRAREISLIVEFCRKNRDLIEDEPDDPVRAGAGWPSPRSWDNLTKVLSRLDEDDLDAIQMAAVGLVGEHAARRYVAWRNVEAQFDLDAILADPGSADWTSMSPEAISTILSSVTATYHGTKKAADWKRAVAVITACAEQIAAKDLCLNAAESILGAAPEGSSIPVKTRNIFAPMLVRIGAWKESA